MRVLLEVDVLRYAYQAEESDVRGAPISKSIEYLEIDLMYCPASISILQEQTSVETNKDGNIVLRLPYERKHDISDNSSSKTAKADGFTVVETEAIESCSAGVSCAACQSLLVPLSSLKGTALLPSGIFDNMMHEFICAEEHAAGLTLQCSEVTTPVGSLLLGDAQVSVNPENIARLGRTNGTVSALIVQCKASPSLLDLFGALVVHSPRHHSDPL